MRILIVSQYFWPENFRINDLALSLKDSGHDVTVLTGEPNYPDGVFFEEYLKNKARYSSYNDIDILRVPILPRKKGSMNLILNYLSFVLSGCLLGNKKLKGRHFDLIFACQLSPVTSVLPAILLKKKYKLPLAMWSLDLWPESLRAVGTVRSEKVLNIVGKVVSYIYGQCDLIFGQSKEYLNAIKERDKTNTPTVIFPNWAEELFNFEKSSDKKSGQLKILFAGNIGDAQDFDSIVECCKLIKKSGKDIVFSIVGDGRRKKSLLKEVELFGLEDYFVFHGQHPLESMPKFYAEADAALVSLKSNDVFSRTIPGKVQSYMLASLPVLGMIDGAAAHLIEESNCGLACPSEDYLSLFHNIERMYAMSDEERLVLGKNAYTYATTEFNKQHLVDKFNHSIELLVQKA